MGKRVMNTGGRIVDRSNVSNGQTDYFYIPLSVINVTQWSLRWQLSNTELRLEFTNQTVSGKYFEDATESELDNLDWEDQTSGRLSNDPETGNDSYGMDEQEPFRLCRVKLDTTSGTNSAKLDLNLNLEE